MDGRAIGYDRSTIHATSMTAMEDLMNQHSGVLSAMVFFLGLSAAAARPGPGLASLRSDLVSRMCGNGTRRSCWRYLGLWALPQESAGTRHASS